MTVDVQKIYTTLKKDGVVDLTPFAREEYLEYRDNASGDEELVTRITLAVEGIKQPVFIASRYTGDVLEESYFYYRDQMSTLRDLLHTWLKLK